MAYGIFLRVTLYFISFAGLAFFLTWVAVVMIGTANIIYYLCMGEPYKEEWKKFNLLYFSSLLLDIVAESLDEVKKKNYSWAVSLFIIVSFLYNIMPFTPLAPVQIGSFFEKKEYKTYYYVNMYGENSDGLCCRVKAEIYADIWSDEDLFERQYHITRAILNENNYIAFTRNGNDEKLTLNKRVYITDDNGARWGIELTDERAAPN